MLPPVPGMPVRTYGALAGYSGVPQVMPPLTNPLYSKLPLSGPGIPNVMPMRPPLQPAPNGLPPWLARLRGLGMPMRTQQAFTTPQGALAAFGAMTTRAPMLRSPFLA